MCEMMKKRGYLDSISCKELGMRIRSSQFRFINSVNGGINLTEALLGMALAIKFWLATMSESGN